LRNLVITGFMGTGKTTVGQAVAARLGRPFVDMDAEIERRAGKPIARIFAEDGEAAFRRWEASICAELGLQRGLVIATGGGALVNPLNRAQMLRNGTVVRDRRAPSPLGQPRQRAPLARGREPPRAR
jgi:shikimate kinase